MPQKQPRISKGGRSPGRGFEYNCLACGKRFNRRDSLKRHGQIHGSSHQHQTSRRRACVACVRSKTKCNEAYPACGRCRQKSLSCTYATARSLDPDHRNSPRDGVVLGSRSVDVDVNIDVDVDVDGGSGDVAGDSDIESGSGVQDNQVISPATEYAAALLSTAFASDGGSTATVDSQVSLRGPGDEGLEPELGPDSIPESMPDFLVSPQQPQAHTQTQTTEQQPSTSWPDVAVSQFIGVGDFYPPWIGPYPLMDNEISASGFPGVFSTYLRSTTLQNQPLDFATVSQDALDAVFLLPASENDDGGSRQDVDGTVLAATSGSDGGHAFASTLIPSLPVLGQEPPQQQPQEDIATSGGEQGTTTTRKVAAARAREEPPDRLPNLESNPNYPSGGYVRRYSLPTVNQAAHKNLCDCLCLPLLRSPWQPMSLAAFPTRTQIDCFIDLYFGHFDWLLPMIHRPTFDPGADPVLTLSMCAIGVFYSDYVNARVFGKSLCELLRRLLLFMSEQNVAVSRSFAYLAAQTLHCVLGNSSGSRRLFEFGDNNRGIIVANARCVRLFDHHDQTYYPPPDGQHQSLQARWEAWICAEGARRLAWSIYIFDASATYYRNYRPHLSLSEMKVDLPCAADLWEAESAPAWAALQPWTNGMASANATLGGTMSRLFRDHASSHQNPGPGGESRRSPATTATATAPAGSTAMSALDKVPDEFHRIIVSTTLLRTVWDQRESMRGPSGMPGLTDDFALGTGGGGGPLAHSSVSREKIDKVLALLGDLTTNALRPAAARAHRASDRQPGPSQGPAAPALCPPRSRKERAFQELILRARVSLVAQIVAADQISHHLDTSWLRRGDGARRLPHEVAAHTLRAWADADPVQPRRMARVGAQLLAISRLYPYNMPREPYDAFRAGLLLWTMVPLVRASTTMVFHPIPIQQPLLRPLRVCQLDWLGDEDAPEAQVVRDWIEHGSAGGDVVLQIQEVPNICTEQGTRQILQHTSNMLRKLHVWGASETYRDIILRALQGDD